MALNKKRLMEAVKHLEKYPSTYDQQYYANKSEDSICGTVGCLAGTLLFLNAPTAFAAEVANGNQDVRKIAARILGIPCGRTVNLFGQSSGWPEPFASNYENAEDEYGRVRVLAARVKHFIKTGK